MVLAGKVLYLGISDTPAWFVTRANEYARNHGLRQFVVYQGKWSAANRDFEREILPMVKYEGMALAPWGALGSGQFKTEEQRQQGGRVARPPTEEETKVSRVFEKLAKEKNTALTSVALAYVLHKAPYVFPIVGGRRVEHLKGNIEALKLELSPNDLKEIEDAYTFEIGFPLNFVYGEKFPQHPSIVRTVENGSDYDYVPEQKPISPAKET
ncbi:putative norsolorinic acid reductase protein [Ilyonectria robusta]